MKYKEGQYYYAPRGRFWNVYIYHGDEVAGCGEFVSSHNTKEEARSEVYKLNGWSDHQQKS